MIDTAVKYGLIWRIVARLALSYAVLGKENAKQRKKKGGRKYKIEKRQSNLDDRNGDL